MPIGHNVQKMSASTSNIIRRQIRLLLLLRVIILSLLLGVTALLQISITNLIIVPQPYILVFILGVYTFSIVSAKLLNHTKQYRFFALCQIIVDSILAGIIVYFSGGGYSIFTFLYFFPVISGGLLLFTYGGLIIATFNLINYTLVIATQYLHLAAHHIPVNIDQAIHDLPNIFLQMSIYGLSFYLVAILSSFLSQRQRHTEDALNTAARNFDRLTELYKQIFADISSGIITVDNIGVITSFNPAAEKITGYNAHESIGYPISRLANFPLSDESKERPTIEIRRKDKAKIPVGYSWARLNMPDSCDDCRVYTLQDLSTIKAMEKKVKQSEKMAAIGAIAAGIAHEFRNPLAAISGAAQVLNQGTNADPDNVSLLKIILRESARLEGKISDFLQFSKPAIPEKQWLSLHNQLHECLDILKKGSKLPDNCQIKVDIAEHLECWADPHQFRQILINLIHNATQSLPTSGGTIAIKAMDITDQHKQASTRLEIRDSGSGMDKKTIAQIFAPFFTTRESGTGLGLSIVQQIVEGHDGKIIAESIPDTGTTFTVNLPLP